jgi:hypothetical protein
MFLKNLNDYQSQNTEKRDPEIHFILKQVDGGSGYRMEDALDDQECI